MAKTISLDEALNIFKGNLSLLSSDQIKEAKKVINEQGTPADKFFLEALTRGDSLDAEKIAYGNLRQISKEINNSDLPQPEKIKARRHWNSFAKSILNDVAKDNGENLQPVAYADVEALAEAVYNGDEAEKSAKEAVHAAIENSRRIFDEENGLNAPQSVLDNNAAVLETLKKEITTDMSSGKTPAAVHEAQTIAENFKAEENAAEKGEDYTPAAFMDMVWDNAAVELLNNEKFAKASPKEQREIFLNQVRVAAHTEAAAIIIAQETSQDKEVIRKTISESVKSGDVSTKEGVRSLFSSFIEKSVGVKKSVVNKIYSKVTAGKALPAAEKVTVQKKSWLASLAAHSAKLDNLQARINDKFKTKTVVGKYLSGLHKDFAAKHPVMAKVAGIAGKIAPSLAVSGAVMLTAGTGIGLPVAAFAAVYRIRRSTKKFFADYNQEAQKDSKLTLKAWWKKADKKKKMLLGSAVVGGIGFIGTSAILASDVLNTTADAADAATSLSDVNIADTLKMSGQIVRKVQMASGLALGLAGAGLAYEEFKKMYKEMSPEEQKALKKKLKVGGVLGMVSMAAVYAAYKVYDNNESNNINELLSVMSDSQKASNGIDTERALLAMRHLINDETMKNVDLPEGVSRESMTLGDLDTDAKNQLLFNIMKSQDIDTDKELIAAVTDGEINNNPQLTADAFNKLNSFGQIVNPQTGEAYSEAEILKLKPEQMAEQVKDYLAENDKEVHSLNDIAAKEFDPVVAEAAQAELDKEAVMVFNAEFQQEAGIGGGLGGVGGYLLVGAGLGAWKKDQLKAKWGSMSKTQKGLWGLGALGLGALAYWGGSEWGDAVDRSSLLDDIKDTGLGEGIDYTRALKALGVNDETLNGKSEEALRDLLNDKLKETTDNPDKFLDLVIAKELSATEEDTQKLFSRLADVGEISLPEGVDANKAIEDGSYLDYLKERVIRVHGSEDGIDVKDIEALEQLADTREVQNILDSQGDKVLDGWKALTGKDNLTIDAVKEKLMKLAQESKDFFNKTADDIEKIFWKDEFAELKKNGSFMAYANKLDLEGKSMEDYLREHDLGNGSNLSGIQSYLVNQSVDGLETTQLQSVLGAAQAHGLVTDEMLPFANDIEGDETRVAFADLTEEQQKDVLKAVINADNSSEAGDNIKDVADLQAHMHDMDITEELKNLPGKEDIAKELGIEGSGDNNAVTDDDIKDYMKNNELDNAEALQAEVELHKEIAAIPQAEKEALAAHLGINKDELEDGQTLENEIRSQMKDKEFDSVAALKADKALTDELTTLDGENDGLTTAYKDNLTKLGYGDAEDGVEVDEVKSFMKEHNLTTKAQLDAYIAEQTAPVALTDDQINLLGAETNGVKVEMPQVDENGNPVLGEDGKPVISDKTADVKSALEGLKEDGKYENITRHDIEEALKEKGLSDAEVKQAVAKLQEAKVMAAPVATQEQVDSNDGTTPVTATDLSQINGEWKLDYHTPEGYDEARFERLNQIKGTSDEAVFRNEYLYRECFKDENGNPMNADQVIAKVKTLDGAGLLEGKPAEMNSQEYLFSRNMLRSYVGGITNKNLGNYLAEAKITKEQWDSVLKGTASKETVDAIFKTNLGPHAARLLMDKDIRCEMKLTVSQQAIVHRGIATLNWDKADEFSDKRIGYYKGPGSVSYDENPYKVYNKDLNHAGMSIDCETQDVHGKGAYGPGSTPKGTRIENDPAPVSNPVPNNEEIELPQPQGAAALKFSSNNITEFQAASKPSAPLFYYNQQVSNTTRTPLPLFMPGEKVSGSEYLYCDEKNRLFRVYSENGQQAQMKVGSVKLDDQGNVVKVRSAAVKMEQGGTAEVPAEPYTASDEVINAEVAKISKFTQNTNGLFHYTAGDTSKYFMPTKQGLVEMRVNDKTGDVSSCIRTYEEHKMAPNLPKETQEALYHEAQEKLKSIRASADTADLAEYRNQLLDKVGSKDWKLYEPHAVKGSEMLVMKAENGVVTLNNGKIEYLHEGTIDQPTHQADIDKAAAAFEAYNKAKIMSQTATHQQFNPLLGKKNGYTH